MSAIQRTLVLAVKSSLHLCSSSCLTMTSCFVDVAHVNPAGFKQVSFFSKKLLTAPSLSVPAPCICFLASSTAHALVRLTRKRTAHAACCSLIAFLLPECWISGPALDSPFLHICIVTVGTVGCQHLPFF